MPISATLASLIVNIVINAHAASKQLTQQRKDLVLLAAKFYLLRTAVYAFMGGLNNAIKIMSDFEKGFIKIENIAENLRNTTFRADFFEMERMLSGLDVRTLQAIAAEVARLGLTSREEILEVTRVIAMFNQSAEMAADRAVLMHGQLAYLFGATNVTQFIREQSDAMIALSEAFPTSERQIADIVTRLAPSGSAFGLNAREITALGATIRSLGLRSQAAGSAVQRLLVKLASEPEEFINALELSNEELVKLMDLLNTDPGRGLFEIFRLLGEGRFDRQARVLADLELSNVRTLQNLIALAQRADKFAEAMEIANRAAAEGIETTGDYIQRMESLESRTNNLKSAWENLVNTISNSELIGSGVQAFADILREIEERIKRLKEQFRIKMGLNPEPLDSTDSRSIRREIATLDIQLEALENIGNAIETVSLGISSFIPFNSTLNIGDIGASAIRRRLLERRELLSDQLQRVLAARRGEAMDEGVTAERQGAGLPSGNEIIFVKALNEILDNVGKSDRASLMSIPEFWKNQIMRESERYQEEMVEALKEAIEEAKKQTGGIRDMVDALREFSVVR